MSSKQSLFHFELNESLYFQSGQEVADVIGASLDPEIAIQAFQDYISIRGVIELSGDYHKADLTSPLDEPPFNTNDVHDKNFMGKVVNKSDSQATFTHRFPVEISVPSYRVNDMEEVTVQVTSFDYEIPNHYQINVTATIEIGGINEEDSSANDEPSEPSSENTFDENNTAAKNVQENDEITPNAENEPEEWQADVLSGEEEMDHENNVVEEKPEEPKDAEEEKLETTDYNEASEENETETLSPEEENVTDTEVQEDTKSEQKKKKKSQTLEDFFSKEEPKNTESQEESDDTLIEENDTDETANLEEYDGKIKTNETIREDEQSNTPILSLSEIFGRHHEEEYSKMRLCIVQDADTITKIAERYDTTSNQIMLKNHLTDESIEVGQILSIPEKAQK